MEGESTATSGSRLNYMLTKTPSSAGTNPPSTCPVTASLIELYRECVKNSVWVCVLYEAHDGIERLTFLAKQLLHLHASLDDDRPERGDMRVTRGAGRPGRRGGVSALRPGPSLVAAWEKRLQR
jgi:hypothetical protein